MTGSDKEVWRPIAEQKPLCDLYEVSSRGRVRSTSQRGRHEPKVLSPGKVGAGYLSIGLYHKGKRLPRYIHRLVAEAFLGSPPTPEHQVAHGDGDKKNNDVSNLSWKTASQNNFDKHHHKTMPIAELHHNCTISRDQVSFIRTCGLSLSEMAKIVPANPASISAIRSMRTRKHG